MAQTVNLRWGAPASTALWNEKINELIGSNLVYKGYSITTGTGKSINLVKGFDDIQRLFINGTAITEDNDLLNIITIPDNSTGSSRTDIIYAEYIHGEGAACRYRIATNTVNLPSADCCEIGILTVPNNFTSSSQITITQPSKMLGLNDLKDIIFGTPENTFQINYRHGVILRQADGTLYLRNAGDSEAADLVIRNLTVLGENISTPQQTITTGDNYILLNNDILPTASPNENAGIQINRGNQAFSSILWDEATDEWKAGLLGLEQTIVLVNNSKLSKLSTDGQISWSYVMEKPQSTVSDIDSAVNKKHDQNTDTTLTGTGANIINTTGIENNIIDFKVNGIIKSSIQNDGTYNGPVMFEKIVGLTATLDNINAAHQPNTDYRLLGVTSAVISSGGLGDPIVYFNKRGEDKTYIDADGNFSGSAARVAGHDVDQSLTKTSDVVFGKVSFNDGLKNNQYIDADENSMYFAMQTEASDKSFLWGVKTDAGFAEKMRLTTDGNLSTNGWINPSKVYNATLNDYAEWYLKGEDTIEPGDVIVKQRGSNKYVKCHADFDTLVVGIMSENAAMCIGGDKLENMDDNVLKYIPVALAGRVPVKVIGTVEEGDLLVTSSVPGHAMSVSVSQLVTPGKTIGTIFAKALENNAGGKQKVLAQIFNG
jgi:hypothetical protein